MKNKIAFISLVIIAVIQFGCGKRVDSVNEMFVGDWVSASGLYTLEIAENSKATWISYEGAATKTFTGKARIKGDKLSIGFKKFDIDEWPIFDTIGVQNTFNYEYRMVLSGEKYLKY